VTPYEAPTGSVWQYQFNRATHDKTELFVVLDGFVSNGVNEMHQWRRVFWLDRACVGSVTLSSVLNQNSTRVD